MATDYDAPRRAKGEDDSETESIEEVRAVERTRAAQSTTTDLADTDEVAASGDFTLPGADLSNEFLEVEVEPQQESEFMCGTCYLVKGPTQLSNPGGRQPVCVDCA